MTEMRSLTELRRRMMRPRAASSWRPLTEQESREQWICCVLQMVASELQDEDSHLGSHYIFCKKVLGEPSLSAMQIAGQFAHVPLTREACERLARDWGVCDLCRAHVAGGQPLCEQCKADVADA